MWSPVLLASGVVLLIGGAVTAFVLLKRQARNGASSISVLATSDTMLTSISGTMLIGMGITISEDERRMVQPECSRTRLIASALLFIVPFVTSFITMTMTSVNCWLDSKAKMNSIQNVKSNNPYVASGLVIQWLFPLISILVLMYITDQNSIIGERFVGVNETCQTLNMSPIFPEDNCIYEYLTANDFPQISNLTSTVIQRIYELINPTYLKPENDGYQRYILSKSRWLNSTVIEQLGKQDETAGNGAVIRQLRQPYPSESLVCMKYCSISSTRGRVYYMFIFVVTYIFPLITTYFLHHQTKVNMQVRLNRQEDNTQIHNMPAQCKCALRLVKHTAVSNFVMWTPSIIELFLKNWLCKSAPQWLTEFFFALGQMNMVVRGALNTGLLNKEKCHRVNAIEPERINEDNTSAAGP